MELKILLRIIILQNINYFDIFFLQYYKKNTIFLKETNLIFCINYQY